ncbi:hypothetical protein M0R04_04080 [Candidatus Dojkabacteria bacterium]|jgi:hypothetical protein|nr:hypothetical protein [Candidatus Dojkabacteria bacterium]
MKKEINVMIVTPAQDGKVNVQYCLSFAHTINMLQSNSITVTPLVVPSSSLLVSERNRLIEAFWQSNCTHVLCIDADLGWPPQAILAMLEQEKDFIAGVYPARGKQNAFTFRPSLNHDGSLITEKHLLKMEYIPAGFLLLSRECIKKMREAYPELYYNPKDSRVEESGGAAFCLFNTEVWEDEFWGEDYVFCRRAREAGIEIWVDPLIQFDHAGTIGMLTECLVQKTPYGETPLVNKSKTISIGQ